MKMGIGTNTQKPDAGEMKGGQDKVACGVWFTSSGTAMPQLIKYKDREEEIHCIHNIRVLTREKKFYCGILVIEYLCSSIQEEETEDEGREILFKLYYYPEECRWKIAWLREEQPSAR